MVALSDTKHGVLGDFFHSHPLQSLKIHEFFFKKVTFIRKKLLHEPELSV